MSLRGQWIARYTGSNTGTVVVDVDELSGHFAGTAIAWDDNPDHPNSFVRLSTSSKATTQHLEKVSVEALDNHGNSLSQEVIERLRTRGLVMPATVDIDLALTDSGLSMQWKSSIGTSGSAVAAAISKSPSDLKPTAARGSWEGFKKIVNALEQKRYIFRGQEDSTWRLRTSFHRTGRADLERYARTDTQDLHRTFSALIQHPFDLTNPLQYAAFINLAQHHGYPTPMLDWTWSPYVAAFFAFRNLKLSNQRGKKVRIFKLDTLEWNKLPKTIKIFGFPPNATILDPLAFGNARAIPQQSVSMVSNVDGKRSSDALLQ